MNRDLNTALHSNEFVEFIESVGSVVKARTSEDFARHIMAEQVHSAGVIKQAGIRLD